MKFFPLHVHSHYSLLDGLSKPKDIAKRCVELDLDGSALTDHGTVSGAVTFEKQGQEANPWVRVLHMPRRPIRKER